MACLDTTSKNLTIELTGSPTTQAQWTVHYATRSGTDFIESSNDGVTNSTTPVTMIAAPGSGETISIRDITVYNADVSSATIVIKLVNGGNSRVLYRQTLDTLESWSSLAQKGKDGAQGLTGSVSAASGLILEESSAPNTATNQGALYVPSSDNLLRYRGESNGTERRIALIDTTNLATNDLFYYGSDGLFKRIAIGTLDQVLVAKPSSNPPYQWATPIYREVLTANRDYYISTTGSDSNNGLSAGSPFLTPQKFADVAGSLDRGIYTITGNFAAGTYSLGSGYLAPKDGVGDGDIIYKGDTSNPENVIFTGTNSNGIIQAYGLSKWHIFEGLKFTNTNNGHIFNVQYASRIGYKSCDFGSVGSGWHIVSANFGMVSNRDTASKITGGSSGFLLLFSSGYADFVNATLTIQNTPTWRSAFALLQNASALNFFNTTVSGSSTGKKFGVNSSSSILNSGSGNNLPGNQSGTNDGTGHLS